MSDVIIFGDHCHSDVHVKTENGGGIVIESEGIEVDHWIYLSSQQAQQLRLFLESLDEVPQEKAS